MNFLTKTSIKTIPLATILALSFVIQAKPLENVHKKVDAKCFVELVGGGESIIFWNIPSKKLSSLSKSITGHKIMVPNSKQKVSIYKTHECVLLKEDFKGSRAKLLDEKTPR